MSKKKIELAIGFARGVILGIIIEFISLYAAIAVVVLLVAIKLIRNLAIDRLVADLQAKYPTTSKVTVVNRDVKDMHTLGSSRPHNIELVRTMILVPSIRAKFIDTYFHERRHDQQRRHMSEQFYSSIVELNSKNSGLLAIVNKGLAYDNYMSSWHETDARRCGRIMTRRYLAA